MVETPNNVNLTAGDKSSSAESGLALPLPLQPLERLSWNYWWSWSADGPGIFRDLDADLWEECEHNPRLLLTRTSEYRLAQMATDPTFTDRVRHLGHDAVPAGRPAHGALGGFHGRRRDGA